MQQPRAELFNAGQFREFVAFRSQNAIGERGQSQLVRRHMKEAATTMQCHKVRIEHGRVGEVRIEQRRLSKQRIRRVRSCAQRFAQRVRRRVATADAQKATDTRDVRQIGR